MSSVKRFEDLIAWQRARELTKLVYEVSRQGQFVKDFGLSNQIQRAAVSIMSNIAEGFERSSAADYRRFLNIAKGSCAEVRSQLYIAYDVGYIDKAQFNRLMTKAIETGKILRGLISAISKHV